MFKIHMLSKKTSIFTTFVNNIDNVHVNDLAYYFFFKKAIYTAIKIQCATIHRNFSVITNSWYTKAK